METTYSCNSCSKISVICTTKELLPDFQKKTSLGKDSQFIKTVEKAENKQPKTIIFKTYALNATKKCVCGNQLSVGLNLDGNYKVDNVRLGPVILTVLVSCGNESATGCNNPEILKLIIDSNVPVQNQL